MREERRIITALFADLAGSTALAERLEAEELKLVVGEAIGRVVLEVERLGGYVKDLAGDGVLAFFGAPVAHEDDAERAARAALNILASIGAYSVDVARGWGVEGFGIRVGIGTGTVALGSIGAGQRVEYAAFGDTVVTAARLQSVADLGTALVDAPTRQHLDRLFEWGDLQMLALKGKADPVPAFRLGAARPAKSRSGGLGGPPVAVIGRDAEVSAMQRVVDDVRAGRGGIVSITGRAGVGKSRLLAESQLRSEAGTGPGPPILWLQGHCASYGEGIPYFPFRDLLRTWLGVGEGDPDVRVRVSLRRAVEQLLGADAIAVYPYLEALLGLSPGDAGGRPVEVTSEEFQQHTFAAVAALLDRLAKDRPIVVALEDLHWADPTSTKLARSILPVVERSALLLVMTQRDERDHAAWGLKEAAARDFPHLTVEITLDSLPTEALRTLLRDLIGAQTLTARIEGQVLEAADGNPFFLEEIVRSLIDAGALVRGDTSGWHLDHDVAIVLPQTVERVILARADRLPPECREVLAAAAVAGREFDDSLLGGLVRPQIPLEGALHDLQRLGFVTQKRRWPRPQYRFKHALIQEAVYGTMLLDERIKLHRAAAESLERHAAESRADVLALARHWDAATVPERAIPCYRTGAEDALRVFANTEAVEALTRALDLIGATPAGPARDAEELELRVMLGVPLVALGGWGTTAVRDDYLRARDLCTQLGFRASAPILRGLAINAVLRLELDDAMELALALLDAAKHDEDPLVTVEANYAAGVTLFLLGEFVDSRRHLEEAIARYSPSRQETHLALYSQDPNVICVARLGWTLWHLGYPEQAVSARDKAVTLADQLGHPFTLCYAYSVAATISHLLGDERGADQFVAALDVIATKEAIQIQQMWVAVYREWSLTQVDPEAIGRMTAAIDRLTATGQPFHRTFFLSLVTRAQLLVDDPETALASVTLALDDVRRTKSSYMESELQRLRGDALLALGAEPVEIEAAYRLAHDVAVRQQAKALELRAAVSLGNWALAGGAGVEKTEALRLLESVYGWFEEGHETVELQAARQLIRSLS